MLSALNDLDARYDGPAPEPLRVAARFGGAAELGRHRAAAQERLFADLARRTLMVLAHRRLALRHRFAEDARLAGLCRALADSRRRALGWRAPSGPS